MYCASYQPIVVTLAIVVLCAIAATVFAGGSIQVHWISSSLDLFQRVLMVSDLFAVISTLLAIKLQEH